MAPPRKMTERQKSILTDFMINHPDLNNARFSDTFRFEDFNRLWNDLVETLNADGSGPVKSVEKWKKTWTDLKLKIKQKKAKIKKSIEQTGGGYIRACGFLTPIEEKIAGLLGLSSMHGIPDAGQTGSEAFSQLLEETQHPQQVFVVNNEFELEEVCQQQEIVESATVPTYIPEQSAPPMPPVTPTFIRSTQQVTVTPTSSRLPQQVAVTPTATSRPPQQATAAVTPTTSITGRPPKLGVSAPFDAPTRKKRKLQNRVESIQQASKAAEKIAAAMIAQEDGTASRCRLAMACERLAAVKEKKLLQDAVYQQQLMDIEEKKLNEKRRQNVAFEKLLKAILKNK